METEGSYFENELIRHCTRGSIYRNPRGAVEEETEVSLAIDVNLPDAKVILCYSHGLHFFSRHQMEIPPDPESPGRFRVVLRMPGEAGLFFYWFSIFYTEGGEEKHMNYVSSRMSIDGSGKTAASYIPSTAIDEPYDQAFQITVYKKGFQTPDWFKGALMYQIFPDRFYRGSRYKDGQMEAAGITNPDGKNETPKGRSERIYHQNWYEDVDIDGKPETGYLACDFFGGTLDGIRERIPYFKSLNIDCLYLNPIFEARSNHHYDTADYMNVDPMLGGNDAFFRFSEAMRDNEIRFLLDGVFSHTGADSVYFNKFGRYPDNGAYQHQVNGTDSPYSSWYFFEGNQDGEPRYSSWWGFPDLPNIQENDLSFRQFLFGKEGVVRSWLWYGASGWRLDVSDELPDSFLREMRNVVKEETFGEGVVLGEVWEDASNKLSYGSHRDFLFGNTHDSVMGYTFRQALLDFLTGVYPAEYLHSALENFRDNYPAEAYYCIMNLISSHDVPRAITVFGGEPDPDDRNLQKKIFLKPEQEDFGYQLMRLAFIFQMGYIGSPCIYYGDEIGMQGYRDPFNRRTYPWGHLTEKQKRQLVFYKTYSGLRKKYPVLKTGDYKTLYAQGDLFVFERNFDDNGYDFFGNPGKGPKRVLVAINRSRSAAIYVESLKTTLKPLSFYIGDHP